MDREYFEAQAKIGPKFAGYVRIGNGSIELRDFWKGSDIFVANEDDRYIMSWAKFKGDDSRLIYYVSSKDWNKKMETLNKPESFESQLARAKALIGKDVKFQSGIFKVDAVKVATYKHDPVGFSGELSLWEEKENLDLFDKQGFLVILRSGAAHNSLQICKEALPYMYVVVNGYQAEKTNYGFKFGCAEISKEQLILARDFLRSTGTAPKTPQNSRNIESVKIGKEDFTLEILNKLLDGN